MKKSSSLESLQTLVHELRCEDAAHRQQTAVRAVRGRGCNESFRAAVDRSYEAPSGEHDHDHDMDTHEWFSRPHAEDFPRRNSPRQSSMNAVYDKHKLGKKKPGLLRGIGSMFRFNRQRKPAEAVTGGEGWRGVEEREAARRAAQEEQRRIQEQYRLLINKQNQAESESFPPPSHQRENSVSSNHAGPVHNGPAAGPYGGPMGPPSGPYTVGPHNGHATQQGLHGGQHNGPTAGPQNGPAGHRREGSNSSTSIHIGSTHGYMNQRESSERRDRTQDVISRNREGSTSSSSSQKQAAPALPAQAAQAAQSRSERIHQLRAQHQRRHVERRRVYPLEEAEEQHERDIRERLESDVYGEICRPGSRVGITDHRYSHYVNYEEIQMHLNKRREHLSDSQIMQMRLQVQHQRFKVEEESRRQQHYHSQRRETRQQRPVSNFYEYESVQTLLGPEHEGNVQALARHFQDKALNGTAENGTARAAHRNGTADSVKRTQGPFVTQVMIGQPQPPGSKV